MALNDQQRQQLDGIVSQMSQNGETDDDIHAVVNDFKMRYDPAGVKADIGQTYDRYAANPANNEKPSDWSLSSAWDAAKKVGGGMLDMLTPNLFKSERPLNADGSINPKGELGQAQAAARQQFQQAKEDFQYGEPVSGAGHALAAAIPYGGPMAAATGQEIHDGSYSRGIVDTIALLGPEALKVPAVADLMTKATAKAADAIRPSWAQLNATPGAAPLGAVEGPMPNELSNQITAVGKKLYQKRQADLAANEIGGSANDVRAQAQAKLDELGPQIGAERDALDAAGAQPDVQKAVSRINGMINEQKVGGVSFNDPVVNRLESIKQKLLDATGTKKIPSPDAKVLDASNVQSAEDPAGFAKYLVDSSHMPLKQATHQYALAHGYDVVSHGDGSLDVLNPEALVNQSNVSYGSIDDLRKILDGQVDFLNDPKAVAKATKGASNAFRRVLSDTDGADAINQLKQEYSLWSDVQELANRAKPNKPLKAAAAAPDASPPLTIRQKALIKGGSAIAGGAIGGLAGHLFGVPGGETAGAIAGSSASMALEDAIRSGAIRRAPIQIRASVADALANGDFAHANKLAGIVMQTRPSANGQ